MFRKVLYHIIFKLSRINFTQTVFTCPYKNGLRILMQSSTRFDEKARAESYENNL